MIKVFGVFLILFLITSCHSRLVFEQRRQHIIERSYPFKKIEVLDVFIAHQYRDQTSFFNEKRKFVHIDTDSVFTIFKNSFLNLKKNINISFDYTNIIYDSTLFDSALNLKDENLLSVIINKTSNAKYRLAPFILLQYTDYRSPTGLRRDYSIILLIILFNQEGSIIYKTKTSYLGEALFIDEISEGAIDLVNSEHWDKLVSKAMRDYIKRLK